MVRDEAGRIGVAVGRLAAGLLVVRRTAGRDFGAVVLGLEMADLGLAVDFRAVADLAADEALVPELADLGVAAEAVPAVVADFVVLRRAADLDLGRADADRGLAAGLVLADGLGVAGVAAAGLADDMDLAAAVRALAAVVMALVAVFIDFMADDIVFADAFAFVAAAVIFVAADVTFVAADETVLAAAAGVALLRLEAAPRDLDTVGRDTVGRDTVARDPVERDVERDAVDRDAELLLDRDAVLRVAGFAAVLLVDRAVVLRVAIGVALDVLVLDMVFGRLAVPPDALRLTDLLRAALAELRRLAARVVD